MEAIATSNKKLLGAPGLTTRNEKLLGAKGIATRNKKLLGAPGLTTRNKKLLGAKGIATRNKKLLVPMCPIYFPSLSVSPSAADRGLSYARRFGALGQSSRSSSTPRG